MHWRSVLHFVMVVLKKELKVNLAVRIVMKSLMMHLNEDDD